MKNTYKNMEIVDKIKKIKYSRLKPEERFLYEKLKGIERFTNNKYPKSIFWINNGIVLFEQELNTKSLWCNYDEIWSIITNKYNYNYFGTQSFIKRTIENNLNLSGLNIKLRLPEVQDELICLTPDYDKYLGIDVELTPHTSFM